MTGALRLASLWEKVNVLCRRLHEAKIEQLNGSEHEDLVAAYESLPNGEDVDYDVEGTADVLTTLPLDNRDDMLKLVSNV